MNLNRLRQDSRLRRRTVLGSYAALVFVAAGGTTVLAWVIPWSHPAHLSDRLAETGDVLAAGTLTLALIAGLVAIQAYAAATGLPDLGVQISFPFSYPNGPVFLAELSDSGSFQIAGPGKQISPEIRVRNTSDYSARNPAVVIRLVAMAFSPDDLNQAWAQIDFAQTQGITAVQWDGGTYSIHGRSTRRLPLLNLSKLHTVPAWGKPSIIIELLAEGYRREIEIPVRFTTDANDSEWGKELPANEQPPRWR